MQCDLSGKVCLVTGAARGIGRAIAEAFAANGGRVVFTDIDEAGVREAATAVPGSIGRRLDVTSTRDIESAVDEIVATCGRLDVVVNNAGVNTLAHRVTIDEFPRDEWDRILSVNLTGLYEVSRFAARAMRAQGSGRIINIASIAGLVPLRLQCAFVAAKAGVVNLTKAMALELGPHGILVNGIAPGPPSPRAPGNSSTTRVGCSTTRSSRCSRTSPWDDRARPARSPSPRCSWPTPRTVT